MPFFKSNYTLRRYGEDTIVNGYPTATYTDIEVTLDVQEMSADEVIEAGGSSDKTMLKAFGDFPISCSKQEDGVRSDELFYNGRWYKCMSSRYSRNTIIRHWTSAFELIPESTNTNPRLETETEVEQ
jgi:hypothetical protein